MVAYIKKFVVVSEDIRELRDIRDIKNIRKISI